MSIGIIDGGSPLNKSIIDGGTASPELVSAIIDGGGASPSPNPVILSDGSPSDPLVIVLDGGAPGTTVFDNFADGGGANRGDLVVAQGSQSVHSPALGVNSATTSQGGETVQATGTVVSSPAATSQGSEHTQATGTVSVSGSGATKQTQHTSAVGVVAISGSVATSQGSETVHATNVVITGTVNTAQGTETTQATGTVRPVAPPQPALGQYGGGNFGGGGGGVAGGYVISMAGFRRRTIEITVCIPGEQPNTIEVQQQEISPTVSVGDITPVAANITVTATGLMNVLLKRPAYNLNHIINTTESNVGAQVLFKQPRAQINDITTIDT